MLLFVHRLLILATALAFLGGATLQAMPVASVQEVQADATQASLPCEHMAAMTQASEPTNESQPCKGVTPDCIKQMGCIGVPNLLPASEAVATLVEYATITYWSPRLMLDGVSHQPDLFPPIAL